MKFRVVEQSNGFMPQVRGWFFWYNLCFVNRFTLNDALIVIQERKEYDAKLAAHKLSLKAKKTIHPVE